MNRPEPQPNPVSVIRYPPDIRLVRAIPISDPASVKGTAMEWLLSGEATRAGFAELLDGVMARLCAEGLCFDRATLHVGTLHPQLLGFRVAWRRDTGVCDEAEVNVHVRETDDFLNSPLRPVIEEGRDVRFNLQDPKAAARYPSMSDLGAAGYTDYWAFPLPRTRSIYNVMTVSTRAPEGFSRKALAALKALAPALALSVDVVALGRIAANVLTAYLGERSGARVLAGDIQRGSGEMIDAIVWISDMRDYTALSDRLPGPEMIRLLNAYFEGLVEAVRQNGGEVLKFIGDGMLAIFPIGPGNPAKKAAAAALAAARAGLASLAALNQCAEDALAINGAWRPLDMGIALHHGSVFYGNIGSPERLDFTVTGPAVNLAARVEPLSKEVGRRLLLTEPVAALLDAPLERLGAFALRGMAEPVTVFAAPEEAAQS